LAQIFLTQLAINWRFKFPPGPSTDTGNIKKVILSKNSSYCAVYGSIVIIKNK